MVGADGVNSLVRRTFAEEFGASVTYLANHFAWFGTGQRYDTLTQTFRHTPVGDFNAHHYRYAAGRSTFIVETDEASFARAGFERMSDIGIAQPVPENLRRRARRPPADLQQFDLASVSAGTNVRWYHGKYVLIGDALHTAHFSIGSGTRLAMEDAIALDRALAEHGDDVAAALPAFEAARRPIVEKLVTGANASAAWYEHFAEHMELAPAEFAMSYVTRSGRVDIERLRKLSPRFIERYERERS